MEFRDVVMDDAMQIDVVVALDARGFLFGPTLALRLKARFVPIRKAGKVCHQLRNRVAINHARSCPAQW